MDTSRYKNGLIYKLCCKDPTIKDIYVGSTCAFRFRKANHKSNCNNEKGKTYNSKVYQFIRENGGWENWDMIQLINYPCNTKRELELKEREYLEMLGGTLNKGIPTRTKTEYDAVHKEEKKEYKKAHYQANKEELKEKHKAYREANKEQLNEKKKEKFKCDCGGRYTKGSKVRHIKTKKHQKFLKSIC
tara:strand:- start:34 stop:597 length:564 start_codon:yes stop_codon:yes gene_type:complete